MSPIDNLTILVPTLSTIKTLIILTMGGTVIIGFTGRSPRPQALNHRRGITKAESTRPNGHVRESVKLPQLREKVGNPPRPSRKPKADSGQARAHPNPQVNIPTIEQVPRIVDPKYILLLSLNSLNEHVYGKRKRIVGRQGKQKPLIASLLSILYNSPPIATSGGIT